MSKTLTLQALLVHGQHVNPAYEGGTAGQSNKQDRPEAVVHGTLARFGKLQAASQNTQAFGWIKALSDDWDLVETEHNRLLNDSEKQYRFDVSKPYSQKPHYELALAYNLSADAKAGLQTLLGSAWLSSRAGCRGPNVPDLHHVDELQRCPPQ